jgi:hypothetical protein
MGSPLVEGLVISETLKIAAGAGRRADCFFRRFHDGLEVDLVLQLKGKLVPAEIKLTATPTLRRLEPLTRFKARPGCGLRGDPRLPGRRADPSAGKQHGPSLERIPGLAPGKGVSRQRSPTIPYQRALNSYENVGELQIGDGS